MFKGDSRCVLCQNGKAIPLSEDHKPMNDQEKKRIEAAGHEVMKETVLSGGNNILL
jgi:serine/threonine protein phosphatase PrpC